MIAFGSLLEAKIPISSLSSLFSPCDWVSSILEEALVCLGVGVGCNTIGLEVWWVGH
jgi:hypothetical protein